MKISTRGRYGTRVLLDLALHKGEARILLKDIAARQQLSLQYVEQLITPLTAAGLVKTSRGQKGGAWLAKPPEQIKLFEVIRVLEGSMSTVDCIDSPERCPRSRLCATRDLWRELSDAMVRILDSTTLEDLAQRQKAKDNPEEAVGNYCI